MSSLSQLMSSWIMAVRARPSTRIVLVDATGHTKVLPPAATGIVLAALQALSDREQEDPMAASVLLAKAVGLLAESTDTPQ